MKKKKLSYSQEPKKLILKMELTFAGGKFQVLKKEEAKIIIGRGSGSDVVVLEEGISRKHLQIEVQEDKLLLTDLGSANGTFVGEDQLNPNEPFEFNTFFIPLKLGKKVTMVLSIEELEENTGTKAK